MLKYMKNIIFQSHLLNSFSLIFSTFKTSLIDWDGDLLKLVLELVTHINTNRRSSKQERSQKFNAAQCEIYK